jgi:hypothetical protein
MFAADHHPSAIGTLVAVKTYPDVAVLVTNLEWILHK